MAKNSIAVVDEEAKGGPKVVLRFSSIKAAEDWIAEREKVEPQKVHRGGYGIDVPEELA